MKLKIFLLICLLSFGINIYSQAAKTNTEPLKVGDIAPDFALKDQNGGEISGGLRTCDRATVCIIAAAAPTLCSVKSYINYGTSRRRLRRGDSVDV